MASSAARIFCSAGESCAFGLSAAQAAEERTRARKRDESFMATSRKDSVAALPATAGQDGHEAGVTVGKPVLSPPCSRGLRDRYERGSGRSGSSRHMETMRG